jgi:hypothetical protein
VDGADLAPDWLRALMMATGWPCLASPSFRDQRIVAAIGDAPWLGTGYGTFPEVFRNSARSAIAAAGSDVTMKRGPVSSDTTTMSSFTWPSCAPQRRRVHDQPR